MERSLAAFAHAAGMMLGPSVLISATIWLIHRRKSRFVAYHALQALAYQIASLLFIFTACGCRSGFDVVTFFIFTIAAEQETPVPPLISWLAIGLALAFLGVIMACVFYAAIAATLVRRGHDFQYPILGRMIEQHEL